MLELYHHNISVCAQKVRLSLYEKGLAWEERHVDLMRSEQISPAYLALNPKGVVPTIVHDGQPVIESTVILEYLEEAFPETPLRPVAPLDRARMRVWAKTPDDGLHAACGTVTYAAAFADQVLAFHGRKALDDRLAKLPDRALPRPSPIRCLPSTAARRSTTGWRSCPTERGQRARANCSTGD